MTIYNNLVRIILFIYVPYESVIKTSCFQLKYMSYIQMKWNKHESHSLIVSFYSYIGQDFIVTCICNVL